MKKGYRFTAEQLATRKSHKKGKWSKAARERQSVRMKERFSKNGSPFKSLVSTNKLSIGERLTIIEHHSSAIRQQLGLEVR